MEAGAKADGIASGDNKDTALMRAAMYGNEAMIRLLIKKGANVNISDKKKQTPVSYAAKMNQDEIVDLLVQNGAIKPDKKNKDKIKTNHNNYHNHTKIEKKTSEEIEQNKKIIMNIQKPKKYILVKINEKGEKTPLTEEEYDEFMKNNPEINDTVNNKNLLNKLVNEITDDDIKMCDSWEKIARQLMNVLWKVKE